MPGRNGKTCGLTLCLLTAILLCVARTADCLAVELVNSFEENWSLIKMRNDKASRSIEFSPPPSQNSSFKWVPSTFGPCFGCGRTSYKAVTHDCVHRLPMHLTIGSYAKSVVGVFKVANSECLARRVDSPSPVNVLGCGPPCSAVRLLRGKNTGCRCDHNRKLAFDVPRLLCKDTKNRTVSLSLCKFLYEQNVHKYHSVGCDYGVVCNNNIKWIAGNWTRCSHNNPVYQAREILCASESPKSANLYFVMHSSMCPALTRPPRFQRCARWTAERRFKCKCSTLKATRRVLCLRRGRARKIPIDEAECSWHAKPITEQPCSNSERLECGRSGRRIV